MVSFVLYISFLVFLISIDISADSSRVFKVGDELGWHEPGQKHLQFYPLWAQRKRFRVGDSLLFEYKNDSVVEVDKWGYYHCNASNSVLYFNNGRSTIHLEKPGLFFFISGAPNHCENGQRLIVDVMGMHHHGSGSPPVVTNPPESDLAPSPLVALGKSSGSTAVSVGSGILLAVVAAFVGSA